jgi:hypothetical protein
MKESKGKLSNGLEGFAPSEQVVGLRVYMILFCFYKHVWLWPSLFGFRVQVGRA